MITIANANALHIPLADRSVQCIVTSPPYYGLRDYGTPGQIGLESTPAAYVASIVAVMRECWRVLKDDGVLWLNLGDSYSGAGYSNHYNTGGTQRENGGKQKHILSSMTGLKPKDLIGIPWRVAFALQDDGWYLRQDIIWHKPNPMPESVTDRCTKAHEYVFLLTKQARYYYDAEAIREEAAYDGRKDEMFKGSIKNYDGVMPDGQPQSFARNGHARWNKDEDGNRVKNKRSVWTVATSPYSGAHFATFPPALIEPMILAGTSARGECPHCGKAWVRVWEYTETPKQTGHGKEAWEKHRAEGRLGGMGGTSALRPANGSVGNATHKRELGWRQQCTCPPHEPIPQTVLDPFAGSGTTGSVAVKHGRRAVLLDLNTKYIDLQFERTNGVQMMFETIAPNSPSSDVAR